MMVQDNDGIVTTVLDNSKYKREIFFPAEFLVELNEILINSTPNETSKVLGLLSAVSAYVYKKKVGIFQKEFEKSLLNILNIAKMNKFKKIDTIFETEEFINNLEGFDIIKKSLRYYFFDFLRKSPSYREKIVGIENNLIKANTPKIYQDEERRIRVFGLETSLNLLRAFSLEESLYQYVRYSIESMTYFSSNKIDEKIFNILLEYKSIPENKDRRAYFIGIGCALGNDEAELSRIQVKKNNNLFEKIFATDIVHNFLYVGRKIHKDSNVIFHYLNINEISSDTIEKMGISTDDLLVIFMSGVLSRINELFLRLSKIFDISDVMIISEGFPFHSDKTCSPRYEFLNMDELIQKMDENFFTNKNYGYNILPRKKCPWDVTTLRDGHQNYEHTELVIIEKV